MVGPGQGPGDTVNVEVNDWCAGTGSGKGADVMGNPGE